MKKNNDFDLLYQLVRTNFKLKYNDSVLGFLWVILKPFMIFLILYIVFSQAAKGSAKENFQIYLLIGVIFYSYFSESIVLGMNSLLDKAHIILKVNFNRSIAVYSGQILAGINLVVNLFVLTVFTIFSKVHLNIESLLYFVLIIGIISCFTMGISFFTSVIFIRFRDLLHITEITLQLLFYASAIFFPIEQVPEKMSFVFIKNIPVQGILKLNPLYILIQSARDAFLFNQINRELQIAVIGVISLILLIAGKAYFKNKVKKVAEYF
jgi:ABC-2 type transport system permease protein